MSFAIRVNPVSYGNGRFAVLGYFNPNRVGVILSSADGVSWSTNILKASMPLDYITFGRDTFLAAAADTRIFQSDPVLPPFQVNASATVPTAYVPGNDNGRITLTRSGSLANQIDLWVRFSLSGTASNGVDYLLITNSAVIPAGQASVSIPIVAQGALDVPWAKSLLLRVEPGEAYSIGESSSAAVSIINPGPVPRFRTSAVTRTVDGAVHLVVDSPVGAHLQIERSANLTNWLPVMTVTNATGTVALEDHADPNQSVQLYRARVVK